MGRVAKIYSDEDLDRGRTKLQELSRKPKGFDLKALLAKLMPEIETAQKFGYSLDEIASALTEQGISIKSNTLKQYIREINPSEEGAMKGKKSKELAAKDAVAVGTEQEEFSSRVESQVQLEEAQSDRPSIEIEPAVHVDNSRFNSFAFDRNNL